MLRLDLPLPFHMGRSTWAQDSGGKAKRRIGYDFRVLKWTGQSLDNQKCLEKYEILKI